ncbi:glycosyltransferase [Parasphingopyxis sp.]|uniref:glycosyltransferase n=1 Tax=Parasphingopyxis sp. TaxID=1920299 RepID=UPI00263A097E|nr:glycosyltransferase [Parasphingopyxis sp.]
MTDRPIKYLSVSLYHPRVMRGGAQFVAKDIHDAAVRDANFDPVMLAGIDGQMFPQYAKVGSAITALPDSANEYILAGQKFDDFFHTIYDQRRNKAVARFLEDHQPDVIHVHHSIWIGLEFLELARKILPNVKIIYTLHEYVAICNSRGQLYRYHENGICNDSSPDQCVKCFPDRSAEEFILRRRMFKRAFGLVDHFIAPSAYLRQRFVDWGIPKDNISVVPNGHKSVRPDDWTPKASASLNVFGFFGQFVDAKGIDILLMAARVAADRVKEDIEVKIFGGNKQHASEDYVARIEAILEDAPKNLTVREMGSYSRRNVFDLMTGIDWAVVPSVWPETFGLVVSEAWDARRPVIAARAGGLDDRIVDGKNGLSFPPGSTERLANIIEDCIGNADLWDRLRSGIKDEITVDAAWQAHVDIIESLGVKRDPKVVQLDSAARI